MIARAAFIERMVCTWQILLQKLRRRSENSKANRIETMKRSRGIWTNLFGGSKKNSEESSEK